MKETLLNHIVFKLPEVTYENYFTYDSVIMIMMVISLMVGLLICFLGYRFIHSFFLILIGCISGSICMYVMENRIDIPVLKMFLLVMFIFLSEVLLYGIYSGYISLLSYLKHKNSNSGLGKIHRILCEKYHTDSPVKDFFARTSPFSGAIVFSAVIYYGIFREKMFCILLAVILSVLGYLFQAKRKAFHRNFYTYDDIYFGR